MTLTAEQQTELKRKAVHVGCGFIAIALNWLTWPQALALALGALAFNLLLLPRLLGRHVHRADERARGWAVGILLYPISVALLVLFWREQLFYVAVGWVLMAFGDGMASVVGILWGRHRLPWNPRKSWEGVLAHVVAGGLAVWGIAWLFLPDARGWPWLFAPCFIASTTTALLESIDSGIDDNLIVPFAGCLAYYGAGAAWDGPIGHFWPALAACSILGGLAVWRGSLTIPGAIAAAFVGAACATVGWAGFGALLAFYLLGTTATKLGRAVKEARGIAEARGGRRGLGNVLANGGLAAYLAIATWSAPFEEDIPLFHVGLVAALATAAFDTVSSEIGKAWGRTTVLVTTLRRVPPGTEGAVSLEGTLAGASGALVVGLVGLFGGLLQPPLVGLACVMLGAFVGTTFESVVGATFERRGHRIQNDMLNFANTLVGAGAAMGLALLFELGRGA